MMEHRQVEQAALFYEFSLEKHIPVDHLTDEDDVLDRLSHRPGRVNDTLQMPNISFGYP